ncbi:MULTISPECIES: hypothetical protein [Xanthomonas]|uniref:hypothetical protein n=1 Tax=Xanthomonas TaxID=338 RepID=UPI001ADC9A13|nr:MULTISPECIES: hypothetical protein [unclassified Xanthomonas]MBO9872452.1 hypothetical protein [Xanthomonas sp. D-93]WNH46095.1 hypothetical protein PG878_06490 [Xanthomonas sp. A6251]
MIGAWDATATDDVAAYLWHTGMSRGDAAVTTPAPTSTPTPAAGTATAPAATPPQEPPTPSSQSPAPAPTPVPPATEATADVQRLLHALSDHKVLEALIKLLR